MQSACNQHALVDHPHRPSERQWPLDETLQSIVIASSERPRPSSHPSTLLERRHEHPSTLLERRHEHPSTLLERIGSTPPRHQRHERHERHERVMSTRPLCSLERIGSTPRVCVTSEMAMLSSFASGRKVSLSTPFAIVTVDLRSYSCGT